MCGICGIIKFDGSPINPELLALMGNRLAHRGPDDEGAVLLNKSGVEKGKNFFVEFKTLSDLNSYSLDSPSYSVGFAHRRLSIIDLSEAAHQPMTNQKKNIWIVYNGEIYNYQDIRHEMLSNGTKFKSKSDTEVILNAYEERGTDCVNRFNGIFAFAIWNDKKRHLFLARDHFGVKPLYYYQDNHCFAFASEIKALLCLPWIHRELDMVALDLLLTFRHVPSPQTLLKGIYKLPPGHGLKVSHKGELKSWDFRDPIPQIEHGKEECEWAEDISNAFLEAGRRQMVADVPIALSLSSGIDSGALLAAMNLSTRKTIDCFTVGFEGGDKINEGNEAKLTASHYRTRFHYRQIKSSDYLDFFQHYIWHLEEPIGNESSAAYYFVAQMAHDAGIKVLLNGQGADEVFGGYPRYLGEKFSPLYRNIPCIIRRRIIRPLISALPRQEQLKRSVYSLGEEDELKRFLKIYTITPPEWKKCLMRNYYDDYKIDNEPALSYLEQELSHIPPGDSLWRMLCLDVRTSLADNLLLCEDKMSMATSVEARVPFLDRDFMNLAYRVPSTLKLKNFKTKHILRKALEPLLPHEILSRPKKGFPNPMELWLRRELTHLIEEFFRDKHSLANNLFNRPYLQYLYVQHKKGRENYQRFFFLYVSLELWAKTFL